MYVCLSVIKESNCVTWKTHFPELMLGSGQCIHCNYNANALSLRSSKNVFHPTNQHMGGKVGGCGTAHTVVVSQVEVGRTDKTKVSTVGGR